MIKVENLAKFFGSKHAVDGVSFSVTRGEVLGFLGPNGAGKSTTMRMITGFIPPTEGKVSVGGFDMVQNPIPAKRLIGAGKRARLYRYDGAWFLEFCG
jgi:ABC-2 type transport system ATP-binding protein